MRKRGRSYGGRRSASRTVRRKVPLPKKRRPQYSRTNALAVRKCVRDIAYLKRARHGEVQKNLQILNRTLAPTATQPCFCVINDIRAENPVSGATGAPWYQLNAGGTNTVVANFVKNQDTYYSEMNSDIVDTGSFYLSKLKLVFRLVCVATNNVQISNKRIRIDFFKQKSRALKTPTALTDIQQLPAVAAQQKLLNMANPAQNMWNSEFFTLIGSRFTYLNPSKTAGTDKGTGAAIKYVSMDVPAKHLGKFTQQLTDPSTPQDPNTDEGWGINNFPISQRIWCMVSCDIPQTTPSVGIPDITVQVQRYVQFRDSIGSSSL